ncbi:hypothetical protein HQ529_03700 [Candidatus Woesearchaeota archaeon]|nr:hypothetical protein [Candidatus Woesearchaeota archaeon]
MIDPIGALVGAVAGVVAGGLGYAKSINNKTDKFNYKKFIPTVVISALAGGVLGAQGLAINEVALSGVATGFGAIGLTNVIENACKYLYRKFKV